MGRIASGHSRVSLIFLPRTPAHFVACTYKRLDVCWVIEFLYVWKGSRVFSSNERSDEA